MGDQVNSKFPVYDDLSGVMWFPPSMESSWHDFFHCCRLDSISVHKIMEWGGVLFY